MIRCFIVDDEQHAIELLKQYISQVPFLNLVGFTTNAIEALQVAATQKIDLFFLDIQMPGMTGIDFVKAINGKSKVILTTAYSEYALEGFELDVIDYLLKPVKLPRFLAAVQKAAKVLHSESEEAVQQSAIAGKFIFVKTEAKGKLLKIQLQDIDLVEGRSNYVAIHQAGKKVLVYTNMKDLEEKLPASEFIRVHRSYIIPISKIVGIEGNRVLLKEVTTEVLIGESYKARLMEIIKDNTIN